MYSNYWIICKCITSCAKCRQVKSHHVMWCDMMWCHIMSCHIITQKHSIEHNRLKQNNNFTCWIIWCYFKMTRSSNLGNPTMTIRVKQLTDSPKLFPVNYFWFSTIKLTVFSTEDCMRFSQKVNWTGSVSIRSGLWTIIHTQMQVTRV